MGVRRFGASQRAAQTGQSRPHPGGQNLERDEAGETIAIVGDASHAGTVQPHSQARRDGSAMSKGAAVIFDMDGVIVDSEPRHEQAFLEVVRSIGYGNNHGLRFADYVGRSDQELWVDFIQRHKPRQTLEELLAMKRERVVEILRRDQPVFEGLPELVEKLAREFSLAVASGSERIVVEEVLALKDLRRFFLAVVTAADVKSGKPAPDIFLRA